MLVQYNLPEKPTREEAQAAVDAFGYKDIEDLAWLISTYLIDRGLDIPANMAPIISEFMKIWDDDCGGYLIRDFPREEWLARIRDVFKLTYSVIEKEIRRQHEKDIEIMIKLRDLLITSQPS